MKTIGGVGSGSGSGRRRWAGRDHLRRGRRARDYRGQARVYRMVGGSQITNKGDRGGGWWTGRSRTGRKGKRSCKVQVDQVQMESGRALWLACIWTTWAWGFPSGRFRFGATASTSD